MKKFLTMIMVVGAFLIVLFFTGACKSTISLDGIETSKLAPVSIIGMALGLYELIVRFWPTVANYSIVAFAIKILKALSDLLNNQKK
jgi:hypothetical protein